MLAYRGSGADLDGSFFNMKLVDDHPDRPYDGYRPFGSFGAGGYGNKDALVNAWVR